MAKVTRSDPSGAQFTGEIIDIVESTERFSDIKLEDGTKIKLKTVVLDVLRSDGQWDSEGNPIYVVKSSNVMSVNVTDESLKKKLQ